MANCTYSDVRLIVDTPLTDANLTSLITLADREMATRGIDGGTADDRKLISMLITAALAAMQEPHQKSMGQYSQQKLDAAGYRREAESHIARVAGSSVEMA